jgi:hypothetical protein
MAKKATNRLATLFSSQPPPKGDNGQALRAPNKLDKVRIEPRNLSWLPICPATHKFIFAPV